MVTGSVDRTPRAPAPQTRNSKRWRIRVSIPVPRRCERRTLPIELIPHRSVTGVGFEPTPPKRRELESPALDHSAIQPSQPAQVVQTSYAVPKSYVWSRICLGRSRAKKFCDPTAETLQKNFEKK